MEKVSLKELEENDAAFFPFLYRDHKIELSGASSNGDVVSVFINEDYRFLNPKDKLVIDIGASIGDSPLYFASKGAKHVFAFELDSDIFNVALYNIKMMSYQDLITVENRMVTDSPLDFTYTESGKAHVMPITLDEIVKEYQIEDSVLKMDCEGCEYGVILSSRADTIRHFSHIQLEYHFGMKKLKRRLLNIGYEVKFSHNRYFKSTDTGILMKAGDLYATRIGE
jgi:FkbM family methyltransferase